MITAGKKDTVQNRIPEKFSLLAGKGEKALVTFITAGDPDLETTGKLVLTLEKAGADIIELGVPYSDPLADGPIIEQASQRALRSGTTLKKIFRTVTELRRETQIPIILMTYYNPLLRYGLDKVAEDAAIAGVDGFIVPDLPMEESDEFKSLLKPQGICMIPLVAPTSGPRRIKMIAGNAEGFVYCVSLTGVTGVREGVPDNLKEFMGMVREATDTPLAVGFGISNPEQVKVISQYCDAVIVGSALVKTIGEKGSSPELQNEVFRMTESLKGPLKGSGLDKAAFGR
ncbi:MAG: tryptophan synthase subunit alpha [Firmicutes bacterium HGW-Firmicutes-14]|nr:MAG: tryptophan synthase subunit alpha [Firmicutes bacterium HGW-Firmicutes-14]